ncbi:hybrid sensor histidine kinase/response regulator [Dyella sp. SG609]|uniref:hybrid sensor histidine kinase/response regulator n=1 Tax=Dyella sp. SG609 TaxID=2587018 RepID=UPI0014458C67|nr:hybrid sensor histidine kinase/response regulator [Dyella sp. SG609]NKJ20966.1 signal transduction histidine kinase/ligand-binding sensor domain-containing protein/CheY-like chemotaxis protein [Dyella sp. SG609]
MFSALILQTLLAAAATGAPPPAWVAPSFRNYGMAEGLPSSNIDALAQDGRGYVWVATESGLARYDGNRFRVWRHDPRDPRSLSAAPLATLMVDAQGQLWGGSRDGLVRYDAAHENFEHWRHDPADPASAGSDDVTALAQPPQGPLWVGHFDVGLDRMRADGRGFDHFRHDPADPATLASDTVYSLLADADGTLWIGTGKGLDRRAPDGRLSHVAFERPDDASRDKPLKIYQLARIDGTLYIAGNRGLYALAPAASSAVPVAPDVLPQTLVYALAADAQHRLWIGTHDGIYLREADGSYRHLEPRPLQRHGLPNGFITQLLRDHEGGLWIGSYDGLAYLSPRWADFQYVTHVPENPDSIVPGAYYAIAGNGGDHLWLAGAKGAIDRLDLATGKVRHLAFHIPQGRSANCIAEDARGRLWIASASGSFVVDGDKATELDAPMAERIVFGADGTAYLQMDDGVQAYDPDTFKARPLSFGPHAKDLTLSDMRLYDGALWFATSAGVLRWAPGDAQARAIEGVPATPFNFLALRDGKLWLVDEQNLSAYRLDGLRAAPAGSYPIYRQHPLNDLLGIHADGLGRLWFFSRSGLWRYDPASGNVREPGLEQGLPDAQFTNVNQVLLTDGRVAAATSDGIAIFVPESIGEHSREPRVRLEDGTVRRGGKTMRLAADAQPWQLDWSDRDLTVNARALTYLAPERTRYRFRLDGLDSDWVETGARGDRSFTQLPGGDYVLHVQAAGPDGAWGETPALAIHADSPPWLRWWAWLAYALLLALLFAALLAAMRRRQAQRHRLELITQEHQLAQAASRAKTQFLAELGHEIRTPMTGVLGMAELLLSRPLGTTERHYAQTIRNSGEVLLTLVNDALDLARIEAGRLQLHPAPFDPYALLLDVADLQRGKAVSKGLALRVHVGADVPPHVSGDAVRVRQILLNLSGNALKFTERGEVRLSLNTDGDGLVFVVSDTGPGIAAADQAKLFQHYQQLDSPQRGSGSGLGLAICRELAGLMGGRIELDSAPGKGSSFRVHLPLPAAASPVESAVRGGEGPRWQLLLLEDDPTVAAVIAGLLEAQGHAVEHVPNALHAMEALERQRFDAALVDLDLPGLDGFQWAGLVRSREQDGRLPMIAITARSGGDEESRAYAAGMDGFLRKPLHGEQLAQALAAVLAGTPAESAG